jgi:hypothetical protein
MSDSLYMQWMRRLQLFLAARPARPRPAAPAQAQQAS